MYRQACNLQLPWDSEHPTFLLKKGLTCQRVCQNNIKFQEAYRYSRMRYNQLTGTYLGTLAKLVFLWICMALSDKQGAIMGYLFPFSQKDLSEPRIEFVVVHVGTKILKRYGCQYFAKYKSSSAQLSNQELLWIVWQQWFFSGNKINSATNNFYPTEWKKNQR